MKTQSFRKNALSSAMTKVMLASMLAGAGLASQQAFAGSVTQALKTGKATVDINVRYESVDQDGANNAGAFTERTRIGYMTGETSGLKAFVEYSGTESLGDRKDYKVPAGPDAQGNNKAVIADPVFTRLNQAWLNYNVSASNIKVGKQRIVMDTRFLGNVGWRQTEQVYSGARATIKEFDGVALDYAYIAEVDNIFGVKTGMSSHALKADFAVTDSITASAYGYLIDTENSTADSQTLGLRLKGATKISDTPLSYQLEIADQTDYADASNIGGSYYHLKLGTKLSGVKFEIAQEKLGGDGTSAFQTALATKHAYNGWADKFLSTPANGLVDTYAKVATKVSGVKLAAVYHDFSAEKGGAHYGSELDLVAVKKFNKMYTLGAKYAAYSADTFATDTSKLWVWAGVKF